MWLIALVALAALAAMAAWARRDERVRDAELKEIRDHADRLGARTIEIRERLIELERRVNIIDNVVTQHSAELDELQRTKHVAKPANLTEDLRAYMGDAVAVPTVTEDEENGDQEKSAPEWMVDAGAAPETRAEADPEETGDTPPWVAEGTDQATIGGYFNTEQ
jgi:hypothetical protein